MSQFTENLEKVLTLVTRNHGNIQQIDKNTFWITDKKQINETNQIEVVFGSVKNWLKVTQSQGNTCCIMPIDGDKGVFQAPMLPISKRMIYEWRTENRIEEKSAGDCDCLILDDRWHFIEFKTEASSQELRQIENNRNKAEAQLAHSLTSFREQLEDSNLECFCVMVSPHFFSYPKFKASSFRKVKFRAKYKCELIEISIVSNDSYDLL